jgi:hypothetical protein
MTKSDVLKKDLPIIILAFSIAVLVPSPISDGDVTQYAAGIALGFGFAWLLVFWKKWKEVTANENASKKED